MIPTVCVFILFIDCLHFNRQWFDPRNEFAVVQRRARTELRFACMAAERQNKLNRIAQIEEEEAAKVGEVVLQL